MQLKFVPIDKVLLSVSFIGNNEFQISLERFRISAGLLLGLVHIWHDPKMQLKFVPFDKVLLSVPFIGNNDFQISLELPNDFISS